MSCVLPAVPLSTIPSSQRLREYANDAPGPGTYYA
jgi:hypothetical protein